MAWTDAFSLKSDVSPTGATQELISGLESAKRIFADFGQPFTITSLSEGQHLVGSKHYIGQAADLRTRDLDPSTIPQLVATLKSNLGSQYFVQREADHIHVQYNGVGTVLEPAGGGDVLEMTPTIDISDLLSDLGFSSD